jgi:hypothetical protein
VLVAFLQGLMLAFGIAALITVGVEAWRRLRAS